MSASVRGAATDVKFSILTQPNMYARNILIGKMKYELGDHSYVRCPENNLIADIEFKTKGYFSGSYNQIGGTIKNSETGQTYYELSGYWNKEMLITDVRVCLSPKMASTRHGYLTGADP